MNQYASVEQLVSGSFELLSMPEIVMRVRQMVLDSGYSAAHIGEVLANDPAMTARLLKIVNSPFYGFPGKVDTVTRAIALIGQNDLYNLVVATSVIDAVQKIPSHGAFDITEFWMGSVNCAVIARMIAQESNVLHIERMFIAGLLHDLGALIFNFRLTGLYEQMRLASNGNRHRLLELEAEELGFNSTDVAAEMMKRWRFSEAMWVAVGCQLKPAEAGSHRLDAHIINLAVRLTAVYMQKIELEKVLEDLDDEIFSVVGLDKRGITDIMQNVPGQFIEIFSLLLPDMRYN